MIDRRTLHTYAKWTMDHLMWYKESYKRYLKRNDIEDILNARNERNTAGVLMDCMSIGNSKCADLLSTPYVYDNVPLLDSSHGRKYLRWLEQRVQKILVMTEKKRDPRS